MPKPSTKTIRPKVKPKSKPNSRKRSRSGSSGSKGGGGILLLILIFGSFLGAAYLLIWQKDNIKVLLGKMAYTPPIYEEAGIYLPHGNFVHGIDVSRYQLDVDWELVKTMDLRGKQVQFAFIKATEGNYLVDKFYEKNWKKSGEHNFIRGAYHFYKPSSDPKEQAAIFIKNVKLKKGDLPPVVDFEEIDYLERHKTIKDLEVCLNILEDHYKVKPIIYTSYSIYRDFLKGKFEEYPLWIAHYNKEQLAMPGNKKWHFWQHSDRGKVNGIKGFVDYNVFNGTAKELQLLCIP